MTSFSGYKQLNLHTQVQHFAQNEKNSSYDKKKLLYLCEYLSLMNYMKIEELFCFNISRVTDSHFTVIEIKKNLSEYQLSVVKKTILELMNIDYDVLMDFINYRRKDLKESETNDSKSELVEEEYIKLVEGDSNWLETPKIVDLLKINNYYFSVYHILDSMTLNRVNTRLVDYVIDNLSFNENYISNYGCEYLSWKLSSFFCIKTLDLSYNGIRDEGVMYLSHSFKYISHLSQLLLNNNKIKSAGLICMCNELENINELTVLDLSHNMIDDNGFIQLSESMSNNIPQLETLKMNNNKLSDDSLEVFSKCVSNFNNKKSLLKGISISYNDISDFGINKLLNGLLFLKNLKTISFYGYNITNYDNLKKEFEKIQLTVTI